MATNNINQAPLVVIVGQTSSGKSGLALELAGRHGGEIICADSRTVYKGMDIGTAKPTADEQNMVPHWGLDLVNPGDRFTAADFKSYAVEVISDIRSRGKVPFLVGGTGLYIDSVVFDYTFSVSENDKMHQDFDNMSRDEILYHRNNNNNILTNRQHNKCYAKPAISKTSTSYMSTGKLIDNTFVVGIAIDKISLRHRIARRIEHMVENGVVDESTRLGNIYGWNNRAMTGNIYSEISQYLIGQITYDEFIDHANTKDWRLAKRQMTWFQRNPYIYWGTIDEIEAYIDKLVKLKCGKIESDEGDD